MGYWKNSRHNHPAYCTCVRCVNARLGRFESGRAQIIKGPRSKRRRSWLIENAGLLVIFAIIAAGFAFLWLRPTPEETAPTTRQLPWTTAPLNDSGKATRTPTPAPKPAPTADELRAFALELINKDRNKHGLPAVTLGVNTAAQDHAEDMLAHRYLGHWWVDGRKPYMVYSEMGGTSYAAENAAISSYSWWAAECEAGSRNCAMIDPEEAIKTAQYNMMYDDAHADWGHRDNILRPGHRAVNIGIAVSDYFVAFVQHFEGGAVTAIEGPTLINGQLRLRASINESTAHLHNAVSVFYDPVPVPRSPSSIDALNSYCLGGGFTEECAESVFAIFPPAEPGWSYDLESDEVEADAWTVTGGEFELRADVRRLTQRPGVYTIAVFGDADTGPYSGIVLALSVTVP